MRPIVCVHNIIFISCKTAVIEILNYNNTNTGPHISSMLPMHNNKFIIAFMCLTAIETW